MSNTDQKGDSYSERETAERAEATLKRMLAMPHKPHKAGGKRSAVRDSRDR